MYGSLQLNNFRQVQKKSRESGGLYKVSQVLALPYW